MKTNKKILDACCGSRMFWFDKQNPDVLFADIRREGHTLCDGRELRISPDVIIDFREMPFEGDTFKMVVFDPPHLNNCGQTSWTAKKYGVLDKKTWKQDIKQGFDECMRILKHNGTLIFKWNETQILTSELLKVLNHEPLIGHKSGKAANTHWMVFMK